MDILYNVIGISAILFLVLLYYLCQTRPVVTDQLLCRWHFRKLLILLPLTLSIPFGLSYISMLFGVHASEMLSQSTGDMEEAGNLWVVAYHYLNSGFMPSATTSTGRWWSLIIALLGTVFMTGILISVLTSVFDTHIEAWKKGEIRYHKSIKDHIVIIGGNELLVPVIKQVFEKYGGYNHLKWWQYLKRPMIVVQTDSDVENLRKTLRKELRSEIENSVIVYSGGRCDPEELEDLMLTKAKEVYVLGESTLRGEAEIHHDSLNMKCTESIAQLMERDNGTSSSNHLLPCHVLFDYHETYSVFQYSDVPDIIKKYLQFIPFNISDNWAQKVLVDGHEGDYTYLPLDGKEGIQIDSEDFVHLVIIGMSRMGIAMATQAAHICHYANFESKGKRTRITFIDANAKDEMNLFKNRFHNLFDLSRWRFLSEGHDTGWTDPMTNTKGYAHLEENFLDVEWEFIESKSETCFVRDYLSESAQEKHAKLTIAICLPDAQKSISTSLHLPEIVYAQTQQILVYQTTDPSILRNAARCNEQGASNGQMKFRNIRPFGMLNTAAKDDELQRRRALMVNAQYTGLDLQSKEARDCWQKLDVALKWSSYFNVNAWPTKFRQIGYHESEGTEVLRDKIDANISSLMRTEHYRWNMEKLLMGYRPLTDQEFSNCMLLPADHKNAEKKRMKVEYHAHLNICSYDMLIKSDPDAMKYDILLSQAIPTIIDLCC